MSDCAIRVENLSKLYRIGGPQERYKTLRDTITHAAAAPVQRLRRLGQPTPPQETIWALKDVSFEVKQGEVLGIIGRNGAGKTTLLRVLSRITEPTEGYAEIHGRVGSLLEVGTGFHPELTGRENIYLNGAILGMKRAEIDQKFDEIVDFAEIERFLDTPAKRYSTGMYVRLAFAVAAHLEPEILLVDEVLAVGDAAFQKKCLGKMDEVAAQGRTVLFVSHNLIAVRSLCLRAMWLEEGSLRMQAPSSDAIAAYLQLGLTRVSEQRWDDPAAAPGNDLVRLHRVWVKSQDDLQGTLIPRESPVQIGVEYWNLRAAQLHITLHIYTEQQVVAFTTASPDGSSWEALCRDRGLLQSVCRIPASFLNSGQHSIGVMVVQDQSRGVYTLRDVLRFEVVESEGRRGGWFGREPGVVSPRMEWHTRLLQEVSGDQVQDGP
jgi:lipopolysaccharide transport system ATP-binding protein